MIAYDALLMMNPHVQPILTITEWSIIHHTRKGRVLQQFIECWSVELIYEQCC